MLDLYSIILNLIEAIFIVVSRWGAEGMMMMTRKACKDCLPCLSTVKTIECYAVCEVIWLHQLD